jgi:hypothetical protein
MTIYIEEYKLWTSSLSIFRQPPITFSHLGPNICLTDTSVFWDITPCTAQEINRLFRGKCRLHLPSRIISQDTKPAWGWKRHITPKRPFSFNGLRKVVSQKIEKNIHNHRCDNLKSYTLNLLVRLTHWFQQNGIPATYSAHRPWQWRRTRSPKLWCLAQYCI